MPKRRLGTRSLAVCGLLGLALAACSTSYEQRGDLPDPAKLATIKPGVANKEAVTQALGSPSTVSTFDDRTWYYISQRTKQTAFFNPEVLDQEVVEVAFDDNGVVRNVTRLTLADARAITPDSRTTPALGREMSLMEEFLGNLGKYAAPGMGDNGGSNLPGQTGH